MPRYGVKSRRGGGLPYRRKVYANKRRGASASSKTRTLKAVTGGFQRLKDFG
jgi:hypothetical protein